MYRDWTFVKDIVSGVVSATDRPLGYEVVNLGRGEPVLLAEFVATLEQITGKRARLVPSPMMDGDVASTHANVSKARRLLGYDPRVSVSEGVSRFWQWYQTAVLEQR
jgi:UDP-glucuronate 4-epimerase